MALDKVSGESERLDLAHAEWEKGNNGGDEIKYVKIVNIDIPFIDLILLLVKLAIAAIPAAIVVSIFWMIIGGFLARILGSF